MILWHPIMLTITYASIIGSNLTHIHTHLALPFIHTTHQGHMVLLQTTESKKSRYHTGGLHVLRWTVRPHALFIHLWQYWHYVAPCCSDVGFDLYNKHLCCFKSPGCLKVLSQPEQTTHCSAMGSNWVGGSVVLHTCTVNPLLFLNQHLHLWHWITPGCWSTEYCITVVHWWWALSPSLLK